MPYTRQQIKDTVSYIIEDAFHKQSAKTQQFLETSLTNIFSRLTKSNPLEIKFTLDKRNPHLFTKFFDWLDEHKVPFPNYTRYVLKRDGSSVADHDGNLELIIKKHKVSSKQVNHYDDIIEGLRDFHLDRQSVLSARELAEEPNDYNGPYNAEGFDPEGYDQDGYDKDGYDEDGYDKNSYDCDGYDEDGNSKPDLDEPFSDRDSHSVDFQSDSDEFSSDEDHDLIDSDYDTVREADEHKYRAALIFERSNQSKSSRSLYFEARKAAQIAKDEAIAKRKQESADLQPIEVSSAKRFTNNPEKVLKTTPMLHGFSSHKAKYKQAHALSTEQRHLEVPVRKDRLRMA